MKRIGISLGMFTRETSKPITGDRHASVERSEKLDESGWRLT